MAGSAIVAATMLGLSGCRSNPESTGWNLWGSKNKPLTNSSVAGPHGASSLPSAGATPWNSNVSTAPPSNAWGSPTGAVSPASASVPPAAGATNYYADPPTGSAGYPSTPYPAVPAAGYSNPPASYNTGAYNTGAAAGYSAGAYNAGAYNSGAANPAAGSGAVGPQNGAYNTNYDGGASAAGNAPYPNDATAGDPNRQSDPHRGGGQYGYGETTYNNSAPGAEAPAYRTADASARPYGGGTADPGATRENPVYNSGTNYDAGGGANYNTDNRYADPNAADRYQSRSAYDAATAGSRANDSAAADGSAGGRAWNSPDAAPVDNSFQPGKTGYTPPGAAPYQGQPSGAAPSYQRRDPFYRPGSTGEYQGGSGSSGSYRASGTGVVPAGYNNGYNAGAASGYGGNAGSAYPSTGAYPNTQPGR